MNRPTSPAARAWIERLGLEPHPEGYALVSCIVAPGFDFHDFELARREDLLARWPHERAIIERLTVG